MPGGYPLAVIQMTDFLVEGTKTKKVKLSLPVEQAAQFVVAKKGTLALVRQQACCSTQHVLQCSF